jgi:hypothetical protein
MDQSSRWSCSRNVGGPEALGRAPSSMPRSRRAGVGKTVAGRNTIGVTGPGICALGVSAGPLARPVTPQQLRDDGTDTGPSQWRAQQLRARSSAETAVGFAYDVWTPSATATATSTRMRRP